MANLVCAVVSGDRTSGNFDTEAQVNAVRKLSAQRDGRALGHPWRNLFGQINKTPAGAVRSPQALSFCFYLIALDSSIETS
jgi:hypothetical protein